MNRLRFIFPTLIQINVVVAILSVVFVIIIREQQDQITTQTQRSFAPPGTVNFKIKKEIANYEQKIQNNQEKIRQYEQQLKELKAELEEYKTQNTLLMQVNRSKPARITSVSPSKTYQSTRASTPKSKQPTSVQSVQYVLTSPKAEPEPKPSVPSTQPIEIADSTIFTTVNFSAPLLEKLPKIGINQEFQIAQKKHEVVDNSENRVNDSKDNVAFIIQNIEPVTISSNSSNPSNLSNSSPQESLPPVTQPTVETLKPDNKRNMTIHYANNIAYGLAIAADEGQINHGTKMYKKVQTAIRLLRQGESTEEATRKSKVPTSVMNQLIKWGEKRPGKLLAEIKEE